MDPLCVGRDVLAGKLLHDDEYFKNRLFMASSSTASLAVERIFVVDVALSFTVKVGFVVL